MSPAEANLAIQDIEKAAQLKPTFLHYQVQALAFQMKHVLENPLLLSDIVETARELVAKYPNDSELHMFYAQVRYVYVLICCSLADFLRFFLLRTLITFLHVTLMPSSGIFLRNMGFIGLVVFNEFGLSTGIFLLTEEKMYYSTNVT